VSFFSFLAGIIFVFLGIIILVLHGGFLGGAYYYLMWSAEGCARGHEDLFVREDVGWVERNNARSRHLHPALLRLHLFTFSP
jgi:hypothetical protein